MKKYTIALIVPFLFATEGHAFENEQAWIKHVEKEFNLPPAPIPEKDNSTVAGIDKNGNGIRDSIERDNAFMFSPDQEVPEEFIKSAKKKVKLLNELERIRRELTRNIDEEEHFTELLREEFDMTICRKHYLTQNENNAYTSLYTQRHLNTEERQKFDALRSERNQAIQHVDEEKALMQCEKVLNRLMTE